MLVLLLAGALCALVAAPGALADAVGTQTQVSAHLWSGDAPSHGEFPEATLGVATAAYNPRSGEYLVVWRWPGSGLSAETPLYGVIQRRVAANGTPIGDEISVRRYPHIHSTALTVGESGNYQRLYNDDVGEGVRILGAALTPSLGTPDGAGSFDSDARPNLDSWEKDDPMSIAAARDGYLVVWQRSTYLNTFGGPTVRAQRLDNNGAEVGESNFPLLLDHRMWPISAGAPTVATNSRTQQWLVIYRTVDFELKATRINRDGVQIGNEILIASGVESGAVVSYNPDRDEFLAVWQDTETAIAKHQIFGRFLDGGGQPISLPFDISRDAAFDYTGAAPPFDGNQYTPDVSYNPKAKQYLVTWTDSYEIYGQTLAGDGAFIGTKNFQMSSMGGAGDPGYRARHPKIAANTDDGEWLVTWDGDNPTDQVWARRVAAGTAAPPTPAPAPPGGPAPGGPGPTTPITPPLVTSPDKTPPKVKIASAGQISLRTARSRGIRVPVTCSEACTIKVKLTVDRVTAKRLHLTRRTIGTATSKLSGAGRKTVTVRIAPSVTKRLRQSKRTRVSVTVRASDPASNATTRSAPITIVS